MCRGHREDAPAAAVATPQATKAAPPAAAASPAKPPKPASGPSPSAAPRAEAGKRDVFTLGAAPPACLTAYEQDYEVKSVLHSDRYCSLRSVHMIRNKSNVRAAFWQPLGPTEGRVRMDGLEASHSCSCVIAQMIPMCEGGEGSIA